MEWIRRRMKEPSSWAAGGVAVIGIGVMVGQPMIYFLVLIAIAAAVIAFVLEEKGIL
jgi:Ca2+/Na+ antiporter